MSAVEAVQGVITSGLMVGGCSVSENMGLNCPWEEVRKYAEEQVKCSYIVKSMFWFLVGI